jgi:putative metallohydrolase (TIGR04338 family)
MIRALARQKHMEVGVKRALCLGLLLIIGAILMTLWAEALLPGKWAAEIARLSRGRTREAAPAATAATGPGRSSAANLLARGWKPIRGRHRAGRAVTERAREPAPPPPAPVPAPRSASQVVGRVLQPNGNPVAGADVTLWERPPGGLADQVLAHSGTDWRGVFSLNDVQVAEEAWLEVTALYYLRAQGEEFAIPPAARIELSPVILHFGATMYAGVRDEAMDRVPHAEVLLNSLSDPGAERMTHTDSRGSFMFNGLAPGEYSLKVLIDGQVAASIAGLRARADAPTLNFEVHLEENSVTFPEEQDLQQFRVYRAERIIASGSKRFESLEDIQRYVNVLIASPWWESVFPEVGAIQVRMGMTEDEPARGGVDSPADETDRSSGHIELPHWAWEELTALHEVAHVTAPGSHHGQKFAGSFYLLVSRMLGDSAANELAMAYAAEGVSW